MISFESSINKATTKDGSIRQFFLSKFGQSISSIISRHMRYIAITISFILAVIFYTSAASYAKNIAETEGVCTIHKAVWNGPSPEATNVPSTYDYVYFGKLDGTKEYTAPTASPSPAGASYKTSYITTTPIKFRVLDTTSNDGSTPALFLLTEYPIGYRRFNSDGQDWKTSEMRKFLNGVDLGSNANADFTTATPGSVYIDCFTEQEREALQKNISKTDKCKKWYSDGYYSCKSSGDTQREGADTSCKLENDRIFLLSAEEVLDNKYGFSTAYSSNAKDVNRKVDETHTGGMCPTWWLRSAYSGSGSSVASVYSSGYSDYYYSYRTGVAVRFALNLPLSSVLFTSDASDVGASPLKVIADRATSESTEFKLTILDNTTVSPESSFSSTSVSPTPASGENSASNPIVMSHGGEKMTIGYENATTGSDEYISVIIRRTSDDYANFEKGNFYGVLKKIDKVADASGTLELTIPEGIPAGKYKVMILNEKRNGAYLTNYAKKFDIHIEISNTQADQTKPLIDGKAYRNATNTGFMINARDNGILESIRYGDPVQKVDISGQVYKTNFETSSAIDSFDIYNIQGLHTTVQSSSCVVDNTPPTVRKVEDNFKWKLIMQDEKSGLWKITDSTGEIIIKDYSGDGYPITQEEFVVPWKYNEVRVYDAVGNYTQMNTSAQSVGTLGYSCIQNPTLGKWDEVRFGGNSSLTTYFNTPTPSSSAITCRVLNTTANDNEKTPALFLLSKSVTKSTTVWDSRNVGSHIWNSSNTSKNYLQNESSSSIYYDCFTKEEKKVIMGTTKTEVGDVEWCYNGSTANPTSCYAGATDLNNEKIFLLSAQELVDRNYGFTSKKSKSKDTPSNGTGNVYDDNTENGYRKAYTSEGGSSTSGWWLRSAYSYNSTLVAYVGSSGCSSYDDSYDGYAVRFALNIPLYYVLFTSDASVASTSPQAATFTTVTPTSTPYKLTIEDKVSSGSFTITEDNAMVAQGGTFTLHYTSTVGNNIRGIIKSTNSSGVTTAYSAKGTVSSGTVSFTVPSTVPVGRYKMIVYNENDKGAYRTNTAKYDTLNLNVVESGTDTQPPTILNVYKNSGGTCYKITAEDNMGLSQLQAGSKVQDISYLNKLGTVNITDVAVNDSVNVSDIANNATPVTNAEVTNTDSTPPDYTITYDSGDYTIHVSDTESGIWKITDSTGGKILKDWSITYQV